MKIQCNCPDNGPAAEYQTKKYGKGVRIGTGPYKRVTNYFSKCTICGKEQQVKV